MRNSNENDLAQDVVHLFFGEIQIGDVWLRHRMLNIYIEGRAASGVSRLNAVSGYLLSDTNFEGLEIPRRERFCFQEIRALAIDYGGGFIDYDS